MNTVGMGCLCLPRSRLQGSRGQRPSFQEQGRKKPPFCSFSFQKALVQKKDLQIFVQKEVNSCTASCDVESGAGKAGWVSATPAQRSAGCGTAMPRWWLLCRVTALIRFVRGMCNTKWIWTSNKPRFTEVSATLQMNSAKTREMRNIFIEVYKLWKNTAEISIYLHFTKLTPSYLGFLLLMHPLVPVKHCHPGEPVAQLGSNSCEYRRTSTAPYIVLIKP